MVSLFHRIYFLIEIQNTFAKVFHWLKITNKRMIPVGCGQHKWTVSTKWAHNWIVNSKYNVDKII